MLKSGIYKIENIINGKFYIGSSYNLSHRKSTHFYDLRNNKHRNIHLQRSFNKWGEESFGFSILEECSIELLIEREQFYIDIFKPPYNILMIAGSGRGLKRPDQSIRIKELNKNRVVSKEAKERTSSTLKEIGHKPTKECTEKSMKVLRKPVLQYDLDGNFIREFISINEACRELNMASANLSRACRGILKTLKGYKWKYKI